MARRKVEYKSPTFNSPGGTVFGEAYFDKGPYHNRRLKAWYKRFLQREIGREIVVRVTARAGEEFGKCKTVKGKILPV